MNFSIVAVKEPRALAGLAMKPPAVFLTDDGGRNRKRRKACRESGMTQMTKTPKKRRPIDGSKFGVEFYVSRVWRSLAFTDRAPARSSGVVHINYARRNPGKIGPSVNVQKS